MFYCGIKIWVRVWVRMNYIKSALAQVIYLHAPERVTMVY